MAEVACSDAVEMKQIDAASCGANNNGLLLTLADGVWYRFGYCKCILVG